MKKVLAALTILTCIILTLVGCKGGNENSVDKGNDDKKQVPVYQGMSISTEKITASAAMKLYSTRAGTNNGNGNNGDNGNHYGQYKGDHDGKDNKVDKDKPFPDNSDKENIENETESSLKVEGALHDIYYAEEYQDIYIHIHISNPDSFEIMSFTLNGKKYSSYMFEDGSDMETIILKYNVGSASGIVEYTIDAIKYVDGTEIKDVIIDGDKTVRAGVKRDNQVYAAVSNLDIGTNSISFNVNVKDNDDLVAISGGKLYAVLYDGFEIIREQELSLGETMVSFDGLKTNAVYQYAIVGYYDDLSGKGFDMNLLAKDSLLTESVVLFSNINVLNDGINFSLLWHESCTSPNLTSLKLYQNDRLVKELSPDATSVRDLLSANTYTLIAEYANQGKTESIYLEFTTYEKGMPIINLTKGDITQNSIGFIITEDDTENVGSIVKIELIHKNGTTVAENSDIRAFTGLLSGNDYTIKVTYTYDLSDGAGVQTIEKELALSTLAKSAPTVNVNNEEITKDSIKADHSITDVDNTLVDYRIDLYKNTEAVATEAKKIDFANLDFYTEYTIKITYSYDLNDGNGAYTVINEYNYTTLAYMDVTDCNIANTSAVSEGETIFMQVNLNNPSGMSVESVVINGETYNVTNASTANRIFVEIVYNGQFAGGDTHLKIDKINAKMNNTSYEIIPETEISDNVFIYGTPSFVKVEYVNQDFEPINYYRGNEKVYVLLTFSNFSGYSVKGIEFSHYIYNYGLGNEDGNENDYVSSNLIYKKSDNEYYFVEYASYYLINTIINSIHYTNEDGSISKTINVTSETSRAKVYICPTWSNREPRYISSVDDLKNMTGDGYYELTNDIDLSGVEWTPYEFYGVLNGNGYSIKNFSYVGTVKDGDDVGIGLFSKLYGVIENLNMKNVLIIVNGEGSSGACGGLVGCSYDSIIYNCTIDSNSIIEASGLDAGGLVGNKWYYFDCKIENCTDNATVIIDF